MCTGRVDLSFIFHAFRKGADGVIIGGCWPGECHYVTEGNYDALGNMHLGRKLMSMVGVSPDRLRLEWIAASEGSRFAEVMSNFVSNVAELGPMGQSEGLEGEALTRKLKAAQRLIPFLKLMEREKLRVETKSEKAYNEYFASDEVDRLFGELVADKFATSQIMTLLEDGPLSTVEISKTLGLNPSEVSMHMNSSSRQGLVKYDVEGCRYALA